MAVAAASGSLWRHLGANMVVLELAVAVVLLAGAGLLGKSFYRLLRVNVGFEPDHLATLQVYCRRRAMRRMRKWSQWSGRCWIDCEMCRE